MDKEKEEKRQRVTVKVCFFVWVALVVVVSLFSVFGTKAEGGTRTVVEGDKIVTYEQTKIREVLLPDKKLNIPNQIALELFSGEREEWVTECIDVEDNFFKYPWAVVTVIKRKVVYNQTNGWQSILLGKDIQKGVSFYLSCIVLLFGLFFLVVLVAPACYFFRDILLPLWKFFHTKKNSGNYQQKIK